MTFLSTVTRKAARVTLGVMLATGLGAASMTAAFAQDVTQRGASMFDENHAFTKTMRKFKALVGEYYAGSVEFDLCQSRSKIDQCTGVTIPSGWL